MTRLAEGKLALSGWSTPSSESIAEQIRESVIKSAGEIVNLLFSDELPNSGVLASLDYFYPSKGGGDPLAIKFEIGEIGFHESLAYTQSISKMIDDELRELSEREDEAAASLKVFRDAMACEVEKIDRALAKNGF